MTTGRINQIAFVADGESRRKSKPAQQLGWQSFVFNRIRFLSPGWGGWAPAGIYHAQSRRRLPRPDEESSDSVTSRNATDRRAPGSLSPTGCCADTGCWKCPTRNTLSAKQPKSRQKGAGGEARAVPCCERSLATAVGYQGSRPTDLNPHRSNTLSPPLSYIAMAKVGRPPWVKAIIFRQT